MSKVTGHTRRDYTVKTRNRTGRIGLVLLMAAIVIGFPRAASYFRSMKTPSALKDGARLDQTAALASPTVAARSETERPPVPAREITQPSQPPSVIVQLPPPPSVAKPLRAEPQRAVASEESSYLPPGAKSERGVASVQRPKPSPAVKPASLPQEPVIAAPQPIKLPPAAPNEPGTADDKRGKTGVERKNPVETVSIDADEEPRHRSRHRKKLNRKRKGRRDEAVRRREYAGAFPDSAPRRRTVRLSTSFRNANFHWPGQ